MNAATKNRQPFEKIKEMVRHAFGEEISEKDMYEPDGGFCNAVYIIKLRDKETVLKIAPCDNSLLMSCEKDMMTTEVEVMRLVKENTDIPVPEIYFADFSCEICSSPYFFMEKVRGKPVTELMEKMSDVEKAELRKKLGKYAKTLHQIKGGSFGLYPDSCKKHSSWKDSLLYIIRNLLDDGLRNGTDLKCISYEDLWTLAVKHSDALSEAKMPCLIHWDMWDGNIFMEDGKITGIIDWERAFWADNFAEHDFSAFEPNKQAYMEGYGITEPSKNEEIRMMYGKLYRMLVMIIECKFRNYENDWQYNWVTGELEQWLKQFRKLTESE